MKHRFGVALSYHLTTSSLVPFAAALMPAAAIAQEQGISVPAMPMAAALERIKQASGAVIEVDPDAVRGLSSKPVSNASGAEAAVRQATRGTPVAVRVDPDGRIVVFNDIVVVARRDEAETSILVRGDTSSSRTGQSLREQARNTQVISAKLMEEQQAQSLPDALRNAGGVVVNSATVQSGTGYSVRGFSSNGSVNGMPTASSSSFAAGSTQPLANVERLEVLKGPDAILLGGDNLGGTVNIVTKKPNVDERFYISAEAGSYGAGRITLDANRALDEGRRFSARVVATAADADRNYGGYRGNEDYLFAPSLRYKDSKTDIIVGTSLGNQVFGTTPYTLIDPGTGEPYDVPMDEPLIGGRNQYIQIKNTQFNAEIRHELTDWLLLVARGQHQEISLHLSQYSPFASLATGGLVLVSRSGVNQTTNNDAFDGYARVSFKTGPIENRIIAGMSYVDIETTAFNASNGGMAPYNFLTGTPSLSPLASTYSKAYDLFGRQKGYYGQYLGKMWKISLMAAVRRTESRTQTIFPARAGSLNEGTATTPSFGIVYDIVPNLSAYGSLSYGFLPTYINDRNGDRLPDIKTRNMEAGVKIDLFDRRVFVNASWFRVRQSNLLVTDPAAPSFRMAVPGQLGEGVDVSVTGEPLKGWMLSGSFTRTEYSYLTSSSLGDIVVQQPRDQYSLYSSYRHKLDDDVSGGLGAGIYGRSSSAIDRRGTYYIPASRQVDLNAFLTVGRLDVNLGVKNIFDRVNYMPTNANSYVPLGEPRTWRLTLGYRFR